MQQRIGEDGMEDLITGAIARKQPLLDRLENPIAKGGEVKIKTDKGKTAKISITKARLLARVIMKFAKYNSRQGGFDIEQLVKIRDPQKLKEYIDDVFSNLDDNIRNELFTGLSKDQINIITSGRFEARIRLDENYEHVLTTGKAKGQTVRLDEIYENDIDMLWHSYTNEMSGWYSLGSKLGVKSRSEWLKYSNQVKDDITDSYKNNPSGKIRQLVNRGQPVDEMAITEEHKTIDSFFNNLMGRSTETGDPSQGYQAWLRDLRRFNFIRVLNQVGIAQLPEFGVVTSQVGLRTLVNQIPAIRKLFDDAQAGKLPDTFRKDMAIIGASNGDDHIYRLHQSLDVLDRGSAKTDFQKGALLSKACANMAEKVTGYASGLLHIDSLQRKIAMRGFVHNLAEDLIEGAKKGNLIESLSKGKLNRYRVLGLSDKDLIALAKEFNSPKVVTQKML